MGLQAQRPKQPHGTSGGTVPKKVKKETQNEGNLTDAARQGNGTSPLAAVKDRAFGEGGDKKKKKRCGLWKGWQDEVGGTEQKTKVQDNKQRNRNQLEGEKLRLQGERATKKKKENAT